MSCPLEILFNGIQRRLSVDTLRQLVGNVGDINCVSESGLTPLLCAIEYTSASTVKMFLDLGADVNAEDNFGRNSLHLALANHAFDIVPLIMQKQPRIDNESPHLGSYPLGIVIEVNRQDLLLMLLKSSAYISSTGPALLKAIAWERVDLVKILLAYKADINTRACGMDVIMTLLYSYENSKTVLRGMPDSYEAMLAYADKREYEPSSLCLPPYQDSSLAEVLQLVLDYGVDLSQFQEELPLCIVKFCPSKLLEILLCHDLPLCTVLQALHLCITSSYDQHALSIIRYLTLISYDLDMNHFMIPTRYKNYYHSCCLELKAAKNHADSIYYNILLASVRNDPQSILKEKRMYFRADPSVVEHKFECYKMSIMDQIWRFYSLHALLQRSFNAIAGIFGISLRDLEQICLIIAEYLTIKDLRALSFCTSAF